MKYLGQYYLHIAASLIPLAILFCLALRTAVQPSDGAAAGGTRELAIRNSKNRIGGEFTNPVHTTVSRPGSTWNTLRLWITGDEVRRPEQALEFPKNSGTFSAAPPSPGLRVTWMGHSTVLIEIDGMRFLTDPVWSARCSPVPLLGPRRFFPVPLDMESLPALDGIIISHDHYDHLDEATIRKLAKRDTRFYAPLGVGAYLEKWGVPPDRIHELDWWDEITVGRNHRLAAAPARHFSGRGIFNRNGTLWASWVILGGGHRVYYGGDGGMFSGFREIGRKYGPFDLTLLEIGAYHENWESIHLGPENAVQAHIDLGGKALMPVHWGTFQLAFHGWTEPAERLIKEARARGVRLFLPVPGRPGLAPEFGEVNQWWKSPSAPMGATAY